jgi:quinolinate synthase
MIHEVSKKQELDGASMRAAQTTALLSLIDEEVRRTTDPIWKKISHLVPAELWVDHAPIIHKILALKKEQDVLILAHNYQNIVIIEGIADIIGDSLQLASAARQRGADKIVVCGVYFMAEMVKLINPLSRVSSPDPSAGCSLADGITAEDIAALRAQHPDAAVVTYVNTSAAVKAASDVCCTSSNAVQIVEALPEDKIIFLPDRHLAGYVARHTDKTIISWQASCEVHDTLSLEQVQELRRRVPDIKILAHPECNAAVQLAADFVGSTSALADYVDRYKPARAALLTECAMRDTIAARSPHTQFIQPCALCRHMQKITLPSILEALQQDALEVTLDPAVAHGARRALDRMLDLSRSPT